MCKFLLSLTLLKFFTTLVNNLERGDGVSIAKAPAGAGLLDCFVRLFPAFPALVLLCRLAWQDKQIVGEAKCRWVKEEDTAAFEQIYETLGDFHSYFSSPWWVPATVYNGGDDDPLLAQFVGRSQLSAGWELHCDAHRGLLHGFRYPVLEQRLLAGYLV